MSCDHAVGGKDSGKTVESVQPGLKVGEGAVISIPIGLDEGVDIEPINVMEEGSVFQTGRQGSVVSKVPIDG